MKERAIVCDGKLKKTELNEKVKERWVIFKKYLWEIRSGSQAVKTLNVTHKTNPSKS